jgi:cytochrome c1
VIAMTKFATIVAALAAILFAQDGAQAREAPSPPRLTWSFASALGTYDQGQLQRGFKVYKEVCQACHGLGLVSFRNLADPDGPGFPVAQAAAIAAGYTVQDGPDDQGEMVERPGRLADRFPPPATWKNEAQARLLYNGTVPPDMSVLAKARSYQRGFPRFIVDALPFFAYQEHGVDYIVALLTGYRDPPAGVQLPAGGHHNAYFSGGSIAMPPPLTDGRVAYTDGTANTLDQQARDVAAFMMWAAEPHLVARKRIGLQVMIVLIALAALLYATKRRVWSAVRSHRLET